MISLHKTPETLVYPVGETITFSHNITRNPFLVTSAEMKTIQYPLTGETIHYQLYGIEALKESPRTEDFNFFALIGTRTKAFGKTPTDATKRMLMKITANKQKLI